MLVPVADPSTSGVFDVVFVVEVVLLLLLDGSPFPLEFAELPVVVVNGFVDEDVEFVGIALSKTATCCSRFWLMDTWSLCCDLLFSDTPL